MDGTEKVRPSSRYYLLAFLSLAVGIGLMIYFLVFDVHRIRNSMVQMDVPGEMDLELKHRVMYSVFAEYPVMQAGSAVSREQAKQMVVSCEVREIPTGARVPVNDTVGASSYTYGGRKGISILEFDVNKDGSYTLKCDGPADASGQKIQVAIGGGASKAISAVAGRSVIALIGGIVIGVLIFVRVAMLRLESRREIREQGLRPV